MYICPLCNGMIDYIKYCPSCGGRMEVYDRVENYDDSYSPYLSYPLTDLNDGDPPSICSHSAQCPVCGMKSIVHVQNIIL